MKTFIGGFVMTKADKMIHIGSAVNQMLSKGANGICNECVIHHSDELYITVEPAGSPWSETHRYICRYFRRNGNPNKVALKTMKTFVIYITLNDDDTFKVGIGSDNCIADYSVINKCVKMLTEMHQHALLFYTPKEEKVNEQNK